MDPEVIDKINMGVVIEKLRRDGASKMWILHFFSHFENDVALEKEKEDCHYCQLRAWDSNELYPVGIIKNAPGDKFFIDPKFRFIEKNVVSKGVEFADEQFLSGCDCKDDCTEECACLQDVELPQLGDDDYDPDSDLKPNPYHTNTARHDGCLKGFMLNSRRPIYECHDKCKCAGKCASRVVGQGRKVPLQIFKTADGRGWGMSFSHLLAV